MTSKKQNSVSADTGDTPDNTAIIIVHKEDGQLSFVSIWDYYPAAIKLYAVIFENITLIFETLKEAENHKKALLERGISAQVSVLTRD